jgi:hypothetical protein
MQSGQYMRSSYSPPHRFGLASLLLDSVKLEYETSCAKRTTKTVERAILLTSMPFLQTRMKLTQPAGLLPLHPNQLPTPVVMLEVHIHGNGPRHFLRVKRSDLNS